jgi:glycosyltransferase involved in cell wall biosynthesis
MDDADQVFSHQVQIVRKLAEKFDEITVITGRVGDLRVPANVKVLTTNWKPNSRLLSIIRFLKVFIRTIFKNRDLTIFSHMTEVQSSLVAPLTWALRIPHYLWYAHVSPSIYLKWSHFWINGVITSTVGSCPIESKKVNAIGQSVDPNQFLEIKKKIRERNKFLHIGRFDVSKNIPEIIQVLITEREKNPKIELAIIGSPSSKENALKAEEVISANSKHIGAGWLKFLPYVKRGDLPEIFGDSDLFIHAFRGSLDKTLIEATMVGIPVVTVNNEYLVEFGSWSGSKTRTSLKQELDAFMLVSDKEVSSIQGTRREIALERHSLDAWINKLYKILCR